MISFMQLEDSIKWLTETASTIFTELKSLRGFEDVTLTEFENFVSPNEVGLDDFWGKKRSAKDGISMTHAVKWVIKGEHVQIVGADSSGTQRAEEIKVPSVTVGTISKDAPLRIGWARFQEYKHNASSGNLKIKTVVQRFAAYHENVLNPEVAKSPKKSAPAADTIEPTDTVEPSAGSREHDDFRSPLEMTPATGGKYYIHVPMTLISVEYALSIRAILKVAMEGEPS